MSQEQITVKPDLFNRMLATLGARYFLDKDFIITMRASELNGPEEFDNAMVFTLWHGYLETGLQQIKSYADNIEQLKRSKEYDKVPPDQKARIDDLLLRFKTYDDSKPIDDKENIRIIRNHLQHYNENLMDGVIFYDVHTAILNGRFARDRGTMKAILEISQNALRREHEIATTPGQGSQDDRSFIEKHLLRKK